MNTKKAKLEAKSAIKQSGKYLYNEDGTPVIVNGKYLFLNEDGTTSLLNHHPSNDKLEKEIAQIMEGEDTIEEMTLDLENTLESEVTENIDSSNDNHQESSTDANWDVTATRLLLSLYKVMRELVTQGKIQTQKRMWIKMAGRFQAHGYNFTACQIENRYKTLLRSYRRKLEAELRGDRIVKEIPFEREVRELCEKEKRNADVVTTPESDHITIAEFLEAAGISGDRDTHYVTTRSPRPRKVFKIAPELATKLKLRHSDGGAKVVASSPKKPAPSSNSPYYTNHARRPDVMEELRDLRINTLTKLRAMEDKRDAFNEKVLQELKYRNELLEKLLEHVP